MGIVGNHKIKLLILHPGNKGFCFIIQACFSPAVFCILFNRQTVLFSRFFVFLIVVCAAPACVLKPKERKLTMKRMKRKTVWAYLDGKKLVDVVKAALDNNMMVDDMKAVLIKENPLILILRRMLQHCRRLFKLFHFASEIPHLPLSTVAAVFSIMSITGVQ